GPGGGASAARPLDGRQAIPRREELPDRNHRGELPALGSRPANSQRQRPELPRPQRRQPLQRGAHLVLPQEHRRLPRRQAAPIPGLD
nr:hypothetical protein [Tanacetum cinerariifolium]